MNLCGQTVQPKPVKADKNPRKGVRKVSRKRVEYRKSVAGIKGKAYMALVAQLPCVICDGWGMRQNSRTEVHHCKSGRFGNLRENDKCTIPLCHSHHNKLEPHKGDEDKLGYHNGQETWEAQYGEDYEFIAATMDAVERIIP